MLFTEFCKIAEINRTVTTIEYYGNHKKEIHKPIYELITFHTARKTFVTNSLILGMPTEAIKEFTGHKSDKVFNKYQKITETYKKKHLDKTWNKI